MTQPIEALRDAHKGETCYIVGKGPSVARLTADMLGPGIIIAINHAILRVRGWDRVIYSSQKDGCVLYGQPHPGKPCLSSDRLTEPVAPERLLVSSKESPDCFGDYEPRYIYTPETDLGCAWNTPSAGALVNVAMLMGCTRIVMVCHDAKTLNDKRTWLPDGRLVDGYADCYLNGAALAEIEANKYQLELEWWSPE